MIFRKWPAVVLSILTASLQAQTRFEYRHPQMGTVFKLVLYAPDSTVAQRAAQATFARVDTLNAILSDYLPESELNRLCAQAGTGRKIRVSHDLWTVLRLSDKFSKQSNGAFDATIGPLTRLWRRARNLKAVPDSAKVEQAKALVGYKMVHFYPRRHRVRLAKRGMQLDFGGIAQGYAADACLEVLRQFKITQALADAGGDIALGDPPPGQIGWEVAVPSTGQTLVLSRCGITSSGASQRFLEVNGVRYSHIIDPRTGWGLTHTSIVTVKAPNATTADAWATALSVDRGLKICDLRMTIYE